MFEHFGNNAVTECLALFFGTFLQEDIAIVTGGILIVKHRLALSAAAVSLYSGIVVSDLLIYGLGVAARYIPWAQRYFVDKKVQFVRNKIEKNIIPSIAICRFLPGLLFPTFVACGWIGVSFLQFTATTIVASAVYTVVMLALVITLGERIFRQIGLWGWIILLCIALIMLMYKIVRPLWHTYITRLMSEVLSVQKNSSEPLETGDGIPPLDNLRREVSLNERIPPILFYTPIVIQWLILGVRYRSFTLPSVANPHIEAGGLWGESKSNLMDMVSDDQSRWIAPFTTITRRQNIDADFESAVEAIFLKGLGFPIVVKPDMGWQGYGVRMLNNKDELRAYLAQYPENKVIILQKPVLHEGEAGVFYIRFPGEERGRITSLTLRYPPQVVGDGKSTIRQLILKSKRAHFKKKFYLGNDKRHAGIYPQDLDAVPAAGEKVQLSFIGSIRVGGLYRNGKQYITHAMIDRFEAIARSIPEFYFGRFDIRFKSIERLQAGEGFSIIEINGAGSEAIHIWDTDTSVFQAYRELFVYQSLLFEISNLNRVNGFKPIGIKGLYRLTMNYQRLLATYPPSE